MNQHFGVYVFFNIAWMGLKDTNIKSTSTNQHYTHIDWWKWKCWLTHFIYTRKCILVWFCNMDQHFCCVRYLLYRLVNEPPSISQHIHIYIENEKMLMTTFILYTQRKYSCTSCWNVNWITFDCNNYIVSCMHVDWRIHKHQKINIINQYQMINIILM